MSLMRASSVRLVRSGDVCQDSMAGTALAFIGVLPWGLSESGGWAQKNRRAGSLRRLVREVADRADLQAFLSSAGDREPEVKAENGDGLAHHRVNVAHPEIGRPPLGWQRHA